MILLAKIAVGVSLVSLYIVALYKDWGVKPKHDDDTENS